MRIERLVQNVFVGLILSSLILSMFHTPHWLGLTGCTGAYLLFCALTGRFILMDTLRRRRDRNQPD